MRTLPPAPMYGVSVVLVGRHPSGKGARVCYSLLFNQIEEELINRIVANGGEVKNNISGAATCCISLSDPTEIQLQQLQEHSIPVLKLDYIEALLSSKIGRSNKEAEPFLIAGSTIGKRRIAVKYQASTQSQINIIPFQKKRKTGILVFCHKLISPR